MRLILLNQHIRLKDLSFLAQDTVILYCFEDFTIGSLSNWHDPETFWQARADLFAASDISLLPEGTRMDYFAWMQLHPRAQERAQDLWDLAKRFPYPISGEVRADGLAAPVFEILATRIVDADTGISALQQRLLDAASEEWTKMARVVGNAMAAGFELRDRVGGGYLRHELWTLSRLDPPLTEIAGTGAMRDCKVRLTTAGLKMRTAPAS